MPSAVIDNDGSLTFLDNNENFNLFGNLNGARVVWKRRASNIEVFAELDPEDQVFLAKKYQQSIYSPDPESAIEFYPFDFWVKLDFQDFLGPFTTREEAVQAEHDELRKRHVI